MVDAINNSSGTAHDGRLGIAAAVYFTDFEIVTILPEDNGKNYVSEISKDTVGKTIASNVKNLTASTVSTSQSLTQSHTASVNSSVSGSNSYSFSEGFKIGTKNEAKIFGLYKGEVTTVIKAEQKKAANEKKTVPKHRRVVYLSTDAKIARVNKTSGKVTGVSKGTCEIYCISQNGLYQVVKIHVK